MVWQLVVLPGAQIVTVTKGVLNTPAVPVGPASTVIVATLGPGEAMLPDPPLPAEAERLLEPPPQADRAKMSWMRANRAMLRTQESLFTGCRRRRSSAAGAPVHRPCLSRRACGRLRSRRARAGGS